MFRRDRESSKFQCGKEGGGVLIAVKNNIKCKRIKDWESNCEDLWVIIDLPTTSTVRRIALCAVYLPPPVRRSALEHYVDHCNAVFEQITDCSVVIVGDFNLASIDWKLVKESNSNSTSSTLNETLIDFTHVNKLYQLNA